jgi:hypothetical protein
MVVKKDMGLGQRKGAFSFVDLLYKIIDVSNTKNNNLQMVDFLDQRPRSGLKRCPEHSG